MDSDMLGDITENKNSYDVSVSVVTTETQDTVIEWKIKGLSASEIKEFVKGGSGNGLHYLRWVKQVLESLSERIEDGLEILT